MRAVLALLLICVLGGATANARPAPTPLGYAVVFEAKTNEAGKVEALSVSRVIDPYSGSTQPVKIDVPEKFISDYRNSLQDRDYTPNSTFFTYGFFDPARPEYKDSKPNNGQP